MSAGSPVAGRWEGGQKGALYSVESLLATGRNSWSGKPGSSPPHVVFGTHSHTLIISQI